MNQSMQSPGPAIDLAIDGEANTSATGDTAAQEGEAVEGEEDTVTDVGPVEVPKAPVYDKNAMEDLAPAERLRINQARSK